MCGVTSLTTSISTVPGCLKSVFRLANELNKVSDTQQKSQHLLIKGLKFSVT